MKDDRDRVVVTQHGLGHQGEKVEEIVSKGLKSLPPGTAERHDQVSDEEFGRL